MLDLPYRDHVNVQSWTASQAALHDAALTVSGDFDDTVFPMDFSNPEAMHANVGYDFGQPQCQPSPGYNQGFISELDGPNSCTSPYSHQSTNFGLPGNAMDQGTGPYGCMVEDEDLYGTMSHSTSNMSYPIPVTDEFSCLDTIGSQPMTNQGSNTGYSKYSSSWDNEDCCALSDELSSHAMSVNTSNIGYSPIAHSQYSQLDTPLSMAVPDDSNWSSSSSGLVDHGTFPAPGVPDTITLPPSGFLHVDRFVS